jgi:hypothetical protein
LLFSSLGRHPISPLPEHPAEISHHAFCVPPLAIHCANRLYHVLEDRGRAVQSTHPIGSAMPQNAVAPAQFPEFLKVLVGSKHPADTLSDEFSIRFLDLSTRNPDLKVSEFSDRRIASCREPPLGRFTAQARKSPFSEDGARNAQPWDQAVYPGLWLRRIVIAELGMMEYREPAGRVSLAHCSELSATSVSAALIARHNQTGRLWHGLAQVPQPAVVPSDSEELETTPTTAPQSLTMALPEVPAGIVGSVSTYNVGALSPHCDECPDNHSPECVKI